MESNLILKGSTISSTTLRIANDRKIILDPLANGLAEAIDSDKNCSLGEKQLQPDASVTVPSKTTAPDNKLS